MVAWRMRGDGKGRGNSGHAQVRAALTQRRVEPVNQGIFYCRDLHEKHLGASRVHIQTASVDFFIFILMTQVNFFIFSVPPVAAQFDM